MPAVFDVIAVNRDTGATRLIAEKLSYEDADAIIMRALEREDSSLEFYKEIPHGDKRGHEPIA